MRKLIVDAIKSLRQKQLQLNIRNMGNQQTSENHLSLTNQQREDWIKIEDQGYCQLWANKKTNKRFQAYPISDAAAKDNVQIEKYAFRKIHNAYLVSAEAVITQNQTFLCSVPATSFVLIQNIISRLKSFPRSFTFQEALYVLSSSASGYNTLCSFFGPLEPNEDMICFNDTGNVKVWLNQNLSKNQASPNARSLQLQLPKVDDCNFAERRSKECVEKLLKIVEMSTIQGYPRAFKEETKKLSTFFEISNFVDYFCMLNRIKILDHLDIKRQPIIPQGQIQVKLAPNPNPIPVRIQQSPALQSSRVNQVFQSNHQRQAVPIFIPAPQQQFVAGPQFRPQMLPPVNVGPWVQNHQILYNYPPKIQTQIISPPSIVVPQPVPPPPQLLIPQTHAEATANTNQIIKIQQTEQTIKETGIEKAKFEFIQQINIQPQIQKLPQIISTPEEHHEIVLPQEGCLNKYKASDPYSEQPQFYEADFSNHYYQNQANPIQQQQQTYQEEDVHVQTNNKGFTNDQENYQHEEQGYYRHEEINKRQVEQPQQYDYVSKSVEEVQNQPPQQNVYQQEYYEEEVPVQEREPNSESIYSNIEPYVPPHHQTYVQQPIEEKKQEYIVSPQKENQIDEWSQKLDNFTNSKAKNHPPPIQIPHPIKEQIVENKEPESFKNLVVSDKKEEYVNQLIDLENDDIEKYIRMKYQAYLKEQSQSQQEPIQEQYQKQPEPEPYRLQYQFRPNPNQTEQDETYNYYQPTSYEYKYQEKWQSNNNYEKENQPIDYQNIYQTQLYPSSNTNRISIEKDFQQDYLSSRRDQPSKYAYQYQNGIEDNSYGQYDRPYISRNKQSERRNSNRNSNIIDEKYSKYVLNSQKPKRQIYNTNSEDVSLILPGEQSNFIKQTPKPILEKSFDHDSFSYNKPSAKKGITYEKLRNLLWEQ